MNAGAEIDNKMAELCTKKTPQSIYHRLSAYKLKQNEDIERLKNYFTVLTAWMCLQEHHLMKFMFKEKLTQYYVKEEDRQAMCQWFKQRITTVVNTTRNFQQIAEALANLYPLYPTDFDGEIDIKHWHVVSADDIKELCRHTFKKYLEKHPNEDAYNIMDKGTELGKLYRTFSVTTDFYAPDDVSQYENFAIDEAISYFSQHKSEKYNKAKTRFELTEDDQRSGYADEISQHYLEDKEFLFGSDGMKFDEYLEKCFNR